MTIDERRAALVERVAETWDRKALERELAEAKEHLIRIRNEVLEEAAKIVESTPFQFTIVGAPPGSIQVVDTSKTIAAAIRALKEKT